MATRASNREGSRFLSNRALARRFQVSYQTADKLMRELVSEGRLERRAASGTYLPGGKKSGCGVLLMFHPRARRKNSFGSRLLEELTAALDQVGIDWRMSWTLTHQGRSSPLPARRYPVIWERLDLVDHAISAGRHALLLNNRPTPGLGSQIIDSVGVDDFSGGAAAAQHLLSRVSRPRRVAILGGPTDDGRSTARIEGFRSVCPATVIHAQTWYYEAAAKVAAKVVAAGQDGIFCCADRLAEGVVRHCSTKGLKRPELVSFDDAPIARWLRLTTMAISWNEMVAAAIRVIQQRQVDQESTAITQLVPTRLIVRD